MFNKVFSKFLIAFFVTILVAFLITGCTKKETTQADSASERDYSLEPNGPREFPLEFPLDDEQINFLEDNALAIFDATVGSDSDSRGEERNEPYRVYLLEGRYEEIFAAYEDCGPFTPFLCKDVYAFQFLYTCDIFNAADERGIRTDFTLATGDFGKFPDSHVPYGAMSIATYSLMEDELPCDFARVGESLSTNVANTTPRVWALALGHKEYLYQKPNYTHKESVNITVDNIPYTVTFKHGTFNDLFTSDESSCSIMFSDLCLKGRAEAERYTKEIIKALGEDSTISGEESTDKFYIPFAPDGSSIKTVSDPSAQPEIDGNCCQTDDYLTRLEPVWWATFSPRVGGYHPPTTCDDEFMKNTRSEPSTKSFDPLDRHTFNSTVAVDMSDFDYYYTKLPLGGDDHTFPDPEDVCKNSNYQGALALNTYSSDKEKITHYVTTPQVIDIATFDRPEDLYAVLGSATTVASRTLRLIHSKYDKDTTLPSVKFHYQHRKLDNLYNDGESLNKYWYLLTTPPSGRPITDPSRYDHTDTWPPGESPGTDPELCWQDNHACKQKPLEDAVDHPVDIEPGKSLVYTIQLAEADDYPSGAESSISDIAQYWYEEELNMLQPTDGGFYIFTDATGILTSYLFQNKDDLLPASTFEVSHGAAYALAMDFKIDSAENNFDMCRASFKMRDDYAVQRIRNNDSASCDENTKSWILPIFKWETRGTLYTKIWAEIIH